jgi:hypothetical protein
MAEERARLRASDAEREQVAAVLRQAMSEGRLTLTEGEERLASTYAATYRDELPAITADLPPAEPGQPPAGRRARGRRRVPGVGLAVIAAVALGIWAVAAGGPVWPAIVLGILAITLAKKARHGFGPPHAHPGRCASARGDRNSGEPVR